MNVDETLLKLVRQIGLKDDSGYGLFDAWAEDFDMPHKGDRYIGDIIRAWEDARTSEQDKMSSKLIFKKRLNYAAKERITDQVELDLVYTEAVNYFLAGKYPVKEEATTNLAALILQVKYGDIDPNEEIVTEYAFSFAF